jgi:hypothetical protein
MKTEQANRVTMFKTVRTYLSQHSSVWSIVAPMAAAVQQLDERIAAVDLAIEKQTLPTKGATRSKADIRVALEDILFMACQALAVLGHASGDLNLLALVELSRSTLGHIDGGRLLQRASKVLEQATLRTQDLLTVNITPAELRGTRAKTGRVPPRRRIAPGWLRRNVRRRRKH